MTIQEQNLSPAPAIQVKGLSKSFDEHFALKNLDLEVASGESLVIFGHNGAGKTTLIKILATVMNPSSGTIKIDGMNVKENAEKVRRRIGVVSHNTYLYDNLTAYENLDFYRRLYDLPEKQITEAAERVGMQHRLHDQVSTLSRGMQQRFSIARAIIHNPSIILLDEPETGLDQQALSMLWDVLKSGGAKKRTVVLATHNLERGWEVADRIIIISRGKIVFGESKINLDLEVLKRAYMAHTGAAG